MSTAMDDTGAWMSDLAATEDTSAYYSVFLFCGLFNDAFRSETIHSCVKMESNTSTVALQVVGDDEKGTQCLGV
jgi:hypothetical protein